MPRWFAEPGADGGLVDFPALTRALRRPATRAGSWSRATRARTRRRARCSPATCSSASCSRSSRGQRPARPATGDRRHRGAGRCRADRPAPAERRPRGGLRGLLHGHPRRQHRQRRAAVDARQPGAVGHRAAVGGQRLHAHLRRPAAGRRTGGGPARPPARLPRRPRAVHRGQPGGWAGPGGLAAGRRAGAAGGGRRHLHAGHADLDHDDVPRAARAGPGARHLVRRGVGRWRPRWGDRGRADRPAGLAVGAVRQRADRRAGARPGGLGAAPGTAAAAPRAAGPARRPHRHARLGLPDRRPGAQRGARLGVAVHAGAVRRRPGAAVRVRPASSGGPRTRSCRCRCSGSGRWRWPTGSACSPPGWSRRCSSSSRCTCSRGWGWTRCRPGSPCCRPASAWWSGRRPDRGCCAGSRCARSTSPPRC